MKRIVIAFIVLLIVSQSVFAQESLRDIVRDYQDKNSEFTLVIPSFLIKMGVAFGDIDDEEKEVLNQIDNMKIVISENKFHNSDFEALERGIKEGRFNELMTVQESNEKVRMIMNKRNKRKSELLMLVESDDENVLMLFNFHGEPDIHKLVSLAD